MIQRDSVMVIDLYRGVNMYSENRLYSKLFFNKMENI